MRVKTYAVDSTRKQYTGGRKMSVLRFVATVEEL